MRSPIRSALQGLALLALLCPGGEAFAQVDDRPATVIGGVMDAASGAPVVGAFVTLLGLDGERVSGSLADDEGRFAMRAPPGRYRLRAERIGIAGVTTDPIELSPGQVVVRDLRVASEAIALEGVSVSGEARCDIRDDRSDASRIWDLARRALDVAAWSDEMGMYEYTSDQWRRQYDARGRSVLVQEEARQTWTGRQAFRSIAADSLAEFGYAQGTDENRNFYAPDASVLLSDSFLDTHCFRAVRDGDRVGLAFEPIEGRDLPDIEGRIWLSENGLLDRLEYEYVNLDGIVGSARTRSGFRVGHLGGDVLFEGLPGGGWIVREWNIRMPQIGVEVDRSGEVVRRFLAGVVEVGAEVVAAEARGARIGFSRGTGAVRGQVLDSVGGSGLDDAIVYLSGAGYSTRTGEDGSFLLEQVRPGLYEVIVEHPLRSELGAVAEVAEVEAAEGEVVDVGVLSFPSRSEVLSARCMDHPVIELSGGFARRGDDIAVVGGILRDPEGRPIDGGRVRVLWSVDDPAAGTPSYLGIEVRSDERGAWFVCGVPNDAAIEVRTAGPDGAQDEGRYRLGRVDPGGRIWVTLTRSDGGS